MRKTLLALSAAGLMAAPALAQTQDIVDTATAAGSFSTLLAAAEAAGLVETLKGDGPYTVFAPTDAAFAALPKGTVEDLLKPENKAKLTEILTYHVVPGEVMSSDLTEGMKAATVEGGELTVSLEGGPKVNGIAISQPDVDASNGVIHVIDGVLMPES
ncbi:fasciclin domain-containing protein [Cereibacter sphaeroides]|uniref:fasciclin domain-containing protein n=1 Tax=Cereibacter sphaeroides TaxID=1063 RepID=UPI001F424534|nr:fasciclin domain-containing protein [Cereibacter sphaeroides]MCE6952159.1 fasciclin domain-containing protein [Cereibacter sphaeroides]MCE6969556.1 fasciclin domain-containing protein [Cereibacter sphaeroides]